MGLDMYLYKVHRDALPYIKYDPDEVKESDPALYAKMKPFIIQCGTPGYYQWESLFEEIGYWRKANQIHKWFVDNVQNGKDDCGEYEVSPDQLKELRERCAAITTQSIRVLDRISNSYTRDGTGAAQPIVEVEMVIINPEVAEELLPTQGGFFFGSTNYDEIYLEEIQDTIDIIDSALNETDLSKYTFYYSSSW